MKAETRSGPAGLAEVRRFVDLEIAPHANTFERAERIPREVLSRVAELGLWAPFLPSEFGGAAMDMVTLGRVHEEVGRGCSSLRSLLTVHTMISASVHRWGDQAQQEKWLQALARGEKLGAFCLTEPDRSGSDATAEGTTAVRDQDGWILNGTKKWITGGQVADLFMVFASTGGGMSTFLVEADQPGVRVTPLPHVSGTTASMLAQIEFTDVRLEPSALLGPQGWAAGTVMTNALGLGRYSVACGAVGIIQAAIEACAAYTTARSAGGVQLRDLPHVRQMMSGMVTARDAGRLLCERAGALNDAGDPATIMATWVAKYHASRAAVQAAGDAVQIHGANGFSPDYPVARLYRDSKVTEVIEGSTQVQELTIAAEAYREVAQ
ncbi:acyl-CoA dehydrogenase family protein [Lentzea flaviverrucosa]|uniref:Acyl-CoA dehydrogenase n=1 Tax=Lentzea flaviverrucosa TaxID=200379 RepID=A0A1H9BX25_9PSEU|nr:acyl-CoA dehydrogenase family protein [Lentzea flaviverrucosa]RDI31659.1 alkylation response protein AidB-like acyl-CoA dehydrogenase [Lentzea flaviverrucosa]SEP92918.1 Acyl-CoA dehydrogenase [Lentzea flaviverrucosa]